MNERYEAARADEHDDTASAATARPSLRPGILDRYVARQVIVSALLVLCVLVALFSFIAFFDDKDSIGSGDYSFARALEYMLLTTPTRAFTLFPVAALIGGARAGERAVGRLRTRTAVVRSKRHGSPGPGSRAGQSQRGTLGTPAGGGRGRGCRRQR